ncbi:MAG: hypothetical protein IJW55_03770 [Clostridia bacterium]|nr:hypothetical protein [Clostridia bacterium]
MKKSRFLLILLSLVMLFQLVACTKDGGDTDTSTAGDETDAPKQTVTLFSDGTFHGTLVYPASNTENEYAQVLALRSYLLNASGAESIKASKDARLTGENYDASTVEILIGFVDYDEVDAAIAKLAHNQYIVQVAGNKIIVAASEDLGLQAAVNAFISYVSRYNENGTLTMTDGFEMIGSAEVDLLDALDGVPVIRNTKVEKIADLGDSHTQVLYGETTLDAFHAYKTALEAAGYTQYTTNTIGNNHFATYQKDNQMVHTYYTDCEKEVRVIGAKDALLPSTEAPTYTKVCDATYTTLAVMTAEGTVSGDALGGIVQLEDGSFIIYDGGNKNAASATQIYSQLVKKAPDKNNIVVRAWIFSHQHGDHVGAFNAYASSSYVNASNIKIESFIYNFCDTEEQIEFLPNARKEFDGVAASIKKFSYDIPVYKCLTGQVFYFPGMQMEILSCMSDFVPQVIGYETKDVDKTNGDGNIMTVIHRMKFASGKTLMLTGDAVNILVDQMCDRFGADYLKSDVMTMPHHGLTGDAYRRRNGTKYLYDSVQPKIAILPSASNKRLAYETAAITNEINIYLVNTYKPTMVLLDAVRTINMSTLEITQ